MNKVINTYPLKARIGTVEMLDHLPAIAINYNAKNASELEERSLREVLDAASADLRDGIVSFRSVRQFRRETFYKLNPGSDGVLPWTESAADVSSAFAIVSFLYSNHGGVRMVDRLNKKTSFSHVSNGDKKSFISPLDAFTGVDEKIVNTLIGACDELLSHIPGSGVLLTTEFFKYCTDLVNLIVNSFSVLDQNANATTESIALYKIARVCSVLREVIASTKSAYGTLKNVCAKQINIPAYIDHSNWSQVVEDLWNAIAAEEATQLIRKGAEFLDTDLIQDAFTVGKFVIEMNTLKPDAYMTIFEKESGVVIEAIDSFNRFKRHLNRRDELPAFLSLAVCADALGIKAMSDDVKVLSRVVLFSVSGEGKHCELFKGTHGNSDDTIRDVLAKQEARLSNVIKVACEVISRFYRPVTYEAWSGCYIQYSDTGRSKIMRRVHRQGLEPKTLMIHEVNKVKDKLSDIVSHPTTGTSVAPRWGYVLNNDTVAAGTDVEAEINGTSITGEWGDLIADAVRLAGVYELAINAESNSVTLADSYLAGYTILPPSEGDDVMSTRPTSRRAVEGREFRVKTVKITSKMKMNDDILFFFRHGELTSGSLSGAYSNRLSQLVTPLVHVEHDFERTNYYAECDVINPLVRKESAGAHILTEYTDCVYLPSAISPVLKDGSVAMQLLKNYLIDSGRALDTKYEHSMTFDDYYLTAFARQSMHSAKDKTLVSDSYRGHVLTTLNGVSKTLTINIVTDDSGIVSYARGDSYKSVKDSKRLVYINYSDPKLNSSVSSRIRFVEENGQLVSPNCLFLSPCMKASLRPVVVNDTIHVAANILRNAVYTLHSANVFNTFKVMGVEVVDKLTVKTVCDTVMATIRRMMGGHSHLADIGLETGSTVANLIDTYDIMSADWTESEVRALMSIIDPVLADTAHTDGVIHPVIPITPATDSSSKIERYLSGGVMMDATSVTSVNIPGLASWFKPNYASFILNSIRQTLDMIVCYV